MFTVLKWAATCQNQQNDCAPSEDSDQPGHPPSLIRVFAVRMKKSWVLSYPLSAQRRLWSDWVDAPADLSLRWAHTHFVGSIMSWLKWWKFCCGSAILQQIEWIWSVNEQANQNVRLSRSLNLHVIMLFLQDIMSFPRLNKSFLQDIMLFPQLKSFPRLKSFPQYIMSFPRLNKSFPQVVPSRYNVVPST